VLTGETGAGKSLIVDAIEALTGKKLGEEVISTGAEQARIEGVFKLDTGSPIATLLDANGIEVEDDLILTRQIGRKNRNVNRANGQTITLRVLKEIGRFLIDIHGQSDQISLSDPSIQLILLDRYAQCESLRKTMEDEVDKYYQIKKQLKHLSDNEHELARRVDLLKYQRDEIQKAELYENEDIELQTEKAVLENVEKLKTLSQESYTALYGGDNLSSSAIDKIGDAVKLLTDLAQEDPSQAQLAHDIEETLYQVQEISQSIRRYYDQLDDNPQRLEQVEQRLSLIRDLQRKYGESILDIIKFGEDAEEELNRISINSDSQVSLQQESDILEKSIGEKAYELSSLRQQAASKLSKEIERQLALLKMENARFEVSFSKFSTDDKVPLPDGELCPLSRTGIDKIDFILSTNPGESFKDMSKIASTGESSRLMLAIKSILSQVDETPTLIFDEIDIGVGGRSGEVIGRMLSSLSYNHQVICITHLPQVAVFADAHFNVRKHFSEEHTISSIISISGQERLQELSMMQGTLSEPSLESAYELLSRAESWKSSQKPEKAD
jgi:DNA repair protein RecN (Recombination protein N)